MTPKKQMFVYEGSNSFLNEDLEFERGPYLTFVKLFLNINEVSELTLMRGSPTTTE